MPRRLSRCFQVALVILAPGLALAQHGGHAGSAHAGGGFHTGPSFSAAPRTFAPPSFAHYSSPQRSGHWPSWNPGYRPYNGGVGYRARYPIFYAGYPWLYGLPLAYGDPYWDDVDDAPPPQQADYYGGQPPVDYGPELAANAPSPFRPAYQVPVETAAVHAQPATTLIFKDGRPPVEVHNYALTGSTLYALNGESSQEIPLSELNLPATVETNRKAGVDFALPAGR
jgi:hypothetical protein